MAVILPLLYVSGEAWIGGWLKSASQELWFTCVKTYSLNQDNIHMCSTSTFVVWQWECNLVVVFIQEKMKCINKYNDKIKPPFYFCILWQVLLGKINLMMKYSSDNMQVTYQTNLGFFVAFIVGSKTINWKWHILLQLLNNSMIMWTFFNMHVCGISNYMYMNTVIAMWNLWLVNHISG